MCETLKKDKHRPKFKFAMESDKYNINIWFQTVRRYVFFSLGYLIQWVD